MTDNTKWGEPIAVDGVRPDWLRNDREKIIGSYNLSGCARFGEFDGQPDVADAWVWEFVDSFRLPASHEFYTVQRYNKEHGTSFTYWPGGDEAPVDWNDGKVLLHESNWTRMLDGYAVRPENWKGAVGYAPVIGYTRRTEQPAADTVTIARMKEAEAREFINPGYPDAMYTSDVVALFRRLGLIKSDPTPAERIATDTGLDLTTVERVLAAQEKLNA